jgi:hypothetical protein
VLYDRLLNLIEAAVAGLALLGDASLSSTRSRRNREALNAPVLNTITGAPQEIQPMGGTFDFEAETSIGRSATVNAASAHDLAGRDPQPDGSRRSVK